MLQSSIGALTTVIAIASFFPYIRDVLRGNTMPHVFSWLVWAVSLGIVAIAQIIDGAGPGAWVSVVSTILNFTVLALAIRQGEMEKTPLDWVSLGGCALAGLGWVLTNRPIVAVAMICIVNVLAYMPTFRKSWSRPHEETASYYGVAVVKHILSLVALANFSWVTALFPGLSLALSILITVELMLRRKSIARTEQDVTQQPAVAEHLVATGGI